MRGRSLRQQHGGAEREGADDLPRTHDPAEVGRPVQDLTRMQVDLVGHLLGDLHQEPAVDVDRALRPTGRAARVGDEQRMLGVERCRIDRLAAQNHDVGPAVVPAGLQLAVGRQTFPDEHMVDAAGHLDRSIRDRLHRYRSALAEGSVRRDQDPAARVRQSRGDRVGPEPAEDRHPDGAQLRARHHRRDRLDRHRQEDPDGVAAGHAEREERPRDGVGQVAELRDRSRADLGVLPFPDDGGGHGRALRPPVDALPGDVGAATDEPCRPRGTAGQVDDLAVGRRELEIEVVYDGIPEPRRILDGSAHQVVEAIDAVRSHEPGDVRRVDLLVRGAPDLVLRRAHRSRPVSSRPISIRRISFVPAPIV